MYYTIAEAAARLGIAPKSLKGTIERRKVPTKEVDEKLYVRLEDLAYKVKVPYKGPEGRSTR